MSPGHAERKSAGSPWSGRGGGWTSRFPLTSRSPSCSRRLPTTPGWTQRRPRGAGGWVLQRLGQPPFPPCDDPAAGGPARWRADLLAARAEQLPELAFDDVADVIAAGVGERPDRWGPAEPAGPRSAPRPRRWSPAWRCSLLSGPPWADARRPRRARGVLLLAAAAAASRAAGDAGAAAVLGYVALPLAFLGGCSGAARPAPLAHLGALELLSGFARCCSPPPSRRSAVAGGCAAVLRRRGRGAARRCGAVAGPGVRRRSAPGRRRAHGRPGAGADPADPGRGVPDGAADRCRRCPPTADELRTGHADRAGRRGARPDRGRRPGGHRRGLRHRPGRRRRRDGARAWPWLAAPADVRRAGLRAAAARPGVPRPGPAAVAVRFPGTAGLCCSRLAAGQGAIAIALVPLCRPGRRDPGRRGHLAARAPAVAVLGARGGDRRHGRW